MYVTSVVIALCTYLHVFDISEALQTTKYEYSGPLLSDVLLHITLYKIQSNVDMTKLS